MAAVGDAESEYR